MHACRIAIATVLLGMASATPSSVNGASLRVGITIVESCNVRTPNLAGGHAGGSVQAECSADTPYNVALGDRFVHGDGRARPARVPGDGAVPRPADQGSRIVTYTF